MENDPRATLESGSLSGEAERACEVSRTSGYMKMYSAG